MSLDLQKIAAAKLWLISAAPGKQSPDGPRDLAYLAHALYALISIESAEVARITCDERWRVYINPTWLDHAAVPDIGRELAHVTWHLLADHAARARDQDVDRTSASAWDKAADVTVSHTLDPDGVKPDGLPTAAESRLRPGLSAEEYFASITGLPVGDRESSAPLAPSEGCGSGADGIARSHEHGPDADAGEISTFDAREIRRRVAIDYRDHAMRRGHDPGDALRWVRQILEPETPWQPILAGTVRRAIGWAAGRGDFTYTRPSRRSSALPGVVLPGQHRPVPRISIIVDTSASVDDGLLARALAEVDGVIAALGIPGSHVTLYSVDAAVHTASTVRRARDAVLVGAGGTDMRIGLVAVELQRPRPDVIIVFTEGDTPWPRTPPPGAAVVAAILGRSRAALPETPTWATRVECTIET